MRLAIVTAWHGRPDLTRRVAEYYTDWCESDTHRRLIAVATVDEHSAINFDHIRLRRHHAAHNVVSDKFNLACNCANLYNADAVMIVGSDDLVSPKYIEEAIRLLEEGVDYIHGNGLYFYDETYRRSVYVPTSAPPGCGRVLSKRLLDMLDWQPYAPGLMKCIEASMAERLKAPWFVEAEIDCSPKDDHAEGRYLVDIKTHDAEGNSENVWPWERFAHGPAARPVDNSYFEAFGWPVLEPIPYVPPVTVEDYELSVDDERARVKLTFSVDHEVSKKSLPDILRDVADRMSYPVVLGPLVDRDHEGRLLT